ncbi:hypothetical protein GCM10027355_36250 [Haloplanus salinarum]
MDLAHDGIDGEAVATGFVSSSTLYRHLTNCVGATKDAGPDRSDWERDRIGFISDWAETNLCGALSSLETKDQLQRGSEATVKLSFFLQCPECGRELSLRRALSQGYICQEHLLEESPKQDRHTSRVNQHTPHNRQTTLGQLGPDSH